MTKLLIVDDSSIIRNKISRIDTFGKFQMVAAAANGWAALAAFAEHQPDVVTMDLTMPEMDGIECIRRLRQVDDGARILVVSALADKATAIRALQEGANGFLCKPFTDDELREALFDLIEG